MRFLSEPKVKCVARLSNEIGNASTFECKGGGQTGTS